ncbi:PITH domain-containing protein [Daedaleopsis nitida]|nr:PITH domain-containing protein [Daedaleopsis nitida]
MSNTEISLLEHLDTPLSTCLNESPDHTLKSIIQGRKKNTNSSAYILSDADAELILNIHFNQTVKVSAIVLHTRDAALGPRELRLSKNKQALSFSDVQDDKGEQELVLGREDVEEGRRIPLRFVRFQSVNSLHIFIQSNQEGGDETRIDAIDILGMPVMGTRDVSGLKKVGEDE